MSAFDPYDDGWHSHRHRDRRDERREDREPRYVETQETYVRSPVAASEPPYTVRTTDVVRRPVREDSDLSVEEVRRDFPPPAGAAYSQRTMVRDDRYGPPARARSAERGSQYGAYLGDPRRSHNDLNDRRRSAHIDQEIVKPRRRSLSRNQKIIAAVGGAALAVGGKELWDRRQAEGRPVSRNPLQSAAVGAAGAFAGYEGAELYARHGGKAEEKLKTLVAHKGRDGEEDEYYTSDEEPARPKRTKSRRKSIVEGALGLAGLGAAANATSGGKGRTRRGSDSTYDSRDRRTRSRSRRGRSPEGAAKFQQAAKAALLAGATEAFRVRNEPGGWGGDKGKRILTAAIGAGGIDAAADRNPDSKSKRHILEAVVGGLASNRLINGSRNNIEDDGRSVRSRSRSRSRSRGPGGGPSTGPLAALATAGLGALASKKLLDRSRSRSRGGGNSRRRRDSSDSYDSRSPSPRRGDRKDRHKRSKSVTDYARNGLAALGIGGAVAGDSHRDREVTEETSIRKSRRGGGGGSDYGGSRRSRDMDYTDPRDPYGDSRYAESRSSHVGSRSGGSRRGNRGHENRDIAEGRRDPGYDSESSLGSSSGDEKRIKKMKGKQLLTAGLATVATIHAAHNVYQSMEKRDARHKAVAEGDMTPEEARKLKAKATLQDVASVGIAALGIKGAYSEIKEANEVRHECNELREKKEERHKKRLARLQSASVSSHGPRQGNEDARRRSERHPTQSGSPYAEYGPRYVDSNPYSASLPAPPVGYERR
ncbi:hypothetical protein PZA11_001336 [Diplocarpon coronariae]|uniref:DUF3824 domain-containing protein n=1 Tax=Diplocarpon coronariae TaxID=2795749 RepID=A0A218Z3E7_9HELO|nr:hypothetical protein JHW43_004065 [Diplocarpon mali]OWP01776.1 hypothetical protein B2J93_470 [Marssonina coronariae]